MATKTAKRPAAKKTTAKKATPKASSASKSAAKKAELPKNYKPTEKEDYMGPNQQEYFRQKLLAWKQDLLEESNETLGHLKEENWQESDIADRATVETDAALELRTRDRYRKLINKIDQAIRRIDEGEYGYCEETGDPIGIKRLEARPIATLSIAAQERHEREEKQYNDDE